MNDILHWLPSIFATPYGMGGAAVVVVLVIAFATVMRAGGGPTDQVRMFSAAQRRDGFSRAGNRCEYDGFLPWLRCTSAAEHADHFFPWSRGGATSMSNQVAACARHNLAKSDHMPSRMMQSRIARRRRRYFPAGVDLAVGQWLGKPAGER